MAVLDTSSNSSPEQPGVEGRISVSRLTLTDFRCYRHLRLDVDDRPVVLAGPNGAGKTNLLEAISFLVPGRGLRGARLADVARRHAKEGVAARPWAVAARVTGRRGAVDVGTGRDAGAMEDGRERRLVHIDGAPAKAQSALADIINAIWLTPRMDRLFNDRASARRRFLDRLVFGFDPAHAGRVAAYERALRERSRLLRQGGANDAWVSALEETMAAEGVAIAAARLQVAARLNEACAASAGPFPGAALDVTGAVEGWLEDGPALAAEDRMRQDLASARAADAVTGGAATGPHRSDLAVSHLENGEPAADCSTGEQKALLVAIVLANAEAQARDQGALPLLLLDEVAAHLDAQRREALLKRLLALGAQAWLSGTDADVFAPLGGRAQFLRVEDATLRPVDSPSP